MEAELDLDDPVEQLVDDRLPVVAERRLELLERLSGRGVDRRLRRRRVGRVLEVWQCRDSCWSASRVVAVSETAQDERGDGGWRGA